MASRVVAALVATLLCTCVSARTKAVAVADADMSANPIRKIVTLLQDMQKEIEAEGAREQQLFDKFMCFCNGGADELTKTAADATQEIETLSSKFEQETAEHAGLEGDLVKHQADRAAATDDLAKAAALRSKENAEYEEDIADQKTSFDALSHALPALEKGMAGASLLQSDGGKTLKQAIQKAQGASSAEKQMVVAFLEGKSTESDPGTSQIVGILKNMGDEMEKSIKEIQDSEDAAVRGFNDLKSAKEQEVEVASEAIEAKTKRVGALAVSTIQAQDGADDATKAKAEAEKTLATLDTQCVEKKKEQAERSSMRAEEVSAISQAVGILNDDDALDVFKKSVPSALLQQAALTHGARKFGFLQVGKAPLPDRLQKAENMIASAAEFHRSQKLNLLSYKMRVQLRQASKGAVDFGQITKQIDEMVSVLTAEQSSDEKHKTWCGSEFTSSADEEAAARSKGESIAASIAEASDETASVAEDIKALQEGIASLDKDVAEATQQRKDEHQEYLEFVQLNEAAVQLMGKAKNRLVKFYNPSLFVAPEKKELSDEDAIISRVGGASLVQISRVVLPDAPETASGAYQPKGQKSGGVMALMDMLVKDLKASLTEAQHAEKTAQTDYTELMGDSQSTRAADSKSILNKEAAKADLESNLVELKSVKQLTMEQLDNVGSYIRELHSSCDFIVDNFKLRTDARANEMESLKNAKAVLAGASYA